MLNWMMDRWAALAAQRTERQLLDQPRWGRKHADVLGSFDVRKFAQLAVALEAGAFYAEHLYNGDFFPTHLDHLRFMAKKASDLGPGAFLEFGVATGSTIRAIAEVTGREIIGFDWFKGMPSDWRAGVKQGTFAGEIPTVPDNVSLQIGLIEDTLPRWLASAPPAEINFIHIDVDLYAPTKLILEVCAPYVRKAVVVFDEFYNYPGWKANEYKAFSEFQQKNAGTFEIEYLGGGGATSVSALLTRRGSDDSG